MVAALVIAGIGLSLRLPAIDGRPEDWDDVDFILGVKELDIARYQPHFPGYPLQIALGKALAVFGADPAIALQSANTLAGALLAVIAFATLLRFISGAAALGGGLLIAVHPLFVSESVSLRPDMLSLAWIAGALGVALSGRRSTAGFLFGIALGFRPSAFALAPLLLAGLPREGTRALRAAGRAGLGLGLATAAWALPFAAATGPTLVSEGRAFLAGHFRDWGGTPFSQARGPNVLDWTKSLWTFLSGAEPKLSPAGLLGTVSIIAAGGLAVRSRRARPLSRSFPVLLLLPYALWMLIAQNPAHGRHLLPIVAAVLAALSFSFRPRDVGSMGLAFVLISTWGLLGALATSADARVRAPAEQLAVFLEDGPGASVGMVYGGESWRILSYRGVGERIGLARARDFEGVVVDVNASLATPASVLVTSEVSGIPAHATPCAKFSKPGPMGARTLEVFAFRTVEQGPGGRVELVPSRLSPRREKG